MSKKNKVASALAASRRKAELAKARSGKRRGDNLIQQSKLVRTWIDGKLLQQEPSVQQMAWVQYRYMTPLERTELFTKTYFNEYVSLIKKHFPDADASKKQPVDVEFVGNEAGVMSSLWSARLAADALGMPYDLYLRTVMEEHIVKDRWKRPPRPNQLYGKLDAPRVRGLLSDDEKLERLYGPEWDPQFKASEYRADPVQDAAREMLVELIDGSDELAERLADYMCERRVLTLEGAEWLFGKKMVAKAQELSDNLPVTGPSDKKLYVPACLGFPDGSDDSPCANCPVMKQCIGFTDKVSEELIFATGSDDPRREAKKKLATLRKRRQRGEAKALFEAMRQSILDDDQNVPGDDK